MKKLIAIILVLLVIGLAAVYYLIPSSLDIVETAGANCVSDAAFRKLSDENDWQKWWPGKIATENGNKSFQLEGVAYSLSQKIMNNIGLQIKNNDSAISSHISLLNLPHDSVLIQWQCTLKTNNNPFQRIKTYREAVALKENMHKVLNAAQTYLSKFENIYGFKFNESSTNDTSLITTKAMSPTYPSMPFVYALIDKLKSFCDGGNCNIVGTPMLNVTPIDSANFQVMVALPLAKTVEGKGEIKSQKMIPGRFVITEVIGGPRVIEETHKQIILYFRDFHRISMAIPFEYLVTDRLKEDSSKWFTRIYSPVY